MKLEMWMMAANIHKCIHEELLQDHSLKIKELDTKAEYKEQAIMELKEELKLMNAKIDAINENVNKLILNSETQDKDIDKRVDNVETKIRLYEQFFHEAKEDKKTRDNMQLTLYALIIAVLGLLANTIFHFV